MRDFMIVSFLLAMLPVPAMAASQFLSTGRWIDAAVALLGWLVFPVAYWWPLGFWLFRGPSHWLIRLAGGYLVSVPLYILCLYVVYASLGYRFEPGASGTWGVYLSVSPWFFLYTVVLWLIVRRQRWPARAARASAFALFAAAILAPAIAAISADSFPMPSSAPIPSRIVNARLVDVPSGTIVDGKDVHLTDGRITAIVDATARAAGTDDGQTVDARGGYLLPGLIDIHAHLQTPISRVDAPFSFRYMTAELFGRYADHRRQYLAHGVTSVRDLGGPAALARDMRDALAGGHLAGPRLFTVGRLVTSPSGHPVDTIWTPTIAAASAILARDAEGMTREIEADITSFRPDAIKIVFGTIGRARTRLGDNLLGTAIRVAAAHGQPAIVHAERTEEVWAAVRHGASGVEHVASMETLPDELLALMRSHQTFADPTFGEYRLLLTQQRETPDAIDKALALARAHIKRLFDAGVPIVVGTDAPLVAYGAGLHDELRELRLAGLTPADVLRSVIVNNAAYLRQAEALGRIAPGFRADLVLVAGNPLDDLDAVRSPLWTMVNGRIMWQTPASRSNDAHP